MQSFRMAAAAGETNVTLSLPWWPEAYLRLAATNDTDGDGLTDAFEALASHSSSATNDTDGDGLLDGWEWAHFGNFAQSGEDDPDLDGVTNLAEQANGGDPNEIRFRVLAEESHWTGPADLTIDVTGGLPQFFAALVNDTNWPAALWQPYVSSNLTLSLPAGGWTEVWIGLAGPRPGVAAVWQGRRFKRDTAPPVLTITNAPRTTWPLLQIHGWSDEDLRGLTYSLGAVTNERVFVWDRHYAAATHEFTTNFFQAYDVELVPGTNVFHLRATDRAGNVTETNFTFVLEADPTAPALTFAWPRPGAVVAADSFTLRGQLDDPSATVTAQWLDAGGQPQTRTAIVERRGRFWLFGLPLSAGTNEFTLRAVDAWTNTLTTNLTVVRAGATVSVFPPNDEELWNAEVPLSGTVSEPGWAVWVNGRPASVSGTNWQIGGVELGKGGVGFAHITTYPPGTEPTAPEEPAGPDAAEPPFNPSDDAAPTVALAWEKPSRIYLDRYWATTWRRQRHEQQDGEISSHTDEETSTTTEWRDGQGGQGGWVSSWSASTNSGGSTSGSTQGTQNWPASLWPALASGEEFIPTPERMITNPLGPPSLAIEWCDVRTFRTLADGTWTHHWEYARQANAELKLIVRGLDARRRQAAWEAAGLAAEILAPHAAPPFEWTPTGHVPPERLVWETFGPFNTWWRRYENLPAGGVVVASVRARGVNHYTNQFSGNDLALQLDRVTFERGGFRAIRPDGAEQPYPGPHWSPTNQHPALFVADTKLTAEAHFTRAPGGAAARVIARAIASGNGQQFILWGTNNLAAGATNWPVEVTATLPLTSNRVDCFTNLVMNWSCAREAAPALMFPAGQSEHTVYVCLESPHPQVPLYHTVVHLACVPPGATNAQSAFQNSWRNFCVSNATAGVKNWRGESLYYYREGSLIGQPANTVPVFLNQSNRNGQCTAWVGLLQGVTRVNGVSGGATRKVTPMLLTFA